MKAQLNLTFIQGVRGLNHVPGLNPQALCKTVPESIVKSVSVKGLNRSAATDIPLSVAKQLVIESVVKRSFAQLCLVEGDVEEQRVMPADTEILSLHPVLLKSEPVI